MHTYAAARVFLSGWRAAGGAYSMCAGTTLRPWAQCAQAFLGQLERVLEAARAAPEPSYAKQGGTPEAAGAR